MLSTHKETLLTRNTQTHWRRKRSTFSFMVYLHNFQFQSVLIDSYSLRMCVFQANCTEIDLPLSGYSNSILGHYAVE